MEKINLNQINKAENFDMKNEKEPSDIYKCLKEECGIDGSMLTEGDLRMYQDLRNGSISVDDFRIYRDRVFNDNRDNLSDDRKDFFAHIASKVMVDYLKKDISIK